MGGLGVSKPDNSVLKYKTARMSIVKKEIVAKTFQYMPVLAVLVCIVMCIGIVLSILYQTSPSPRSKPLLQGNIW